MASQTFSFTLRLADSDLDLDAVCRVRSDGYGHHVPGLREPLAVPDAVDLDPGTVIFVCHDKATGQAVGTARVQVSTRAALLIESCAEVPLEMQRQARAEISRLSAVRSADPLVKLALWKASYLFCQAAQARWMVIGARSEALVRQYNRLGFTDVYPDKRMIALSYAGGVAHRVLSFDIVTAERKWKEANNPLYGFIFETTHPDIQLHRAPSFSRKHSEHAAAAQSQEKVWRDAAGVVG